MLLVTPLRRLGSTDHQHGFVSKAGGTRLAVGCGIHLKQLWLACAVYSLYRLHFRRTYLVCTSNGPYRMSSPEPCSFLLFGPEDHTFIWNTSALRPERSVEVLTRTSFIQSGMPHGSRPLGNTRKSSPR